MEASSPLRAVRSWEEARAGRGSDRDVHAAMLLTVGECGYGEATVGRIAERAGISQVTFHRRYGSKEEGFALAYEEAAGRLCGELLEACSSAPSWREGFQAALTRLLRFVATEPALARALLIEVQAARGRAWLVHQELVEHIVEAIDAGARRESGARPSAGALAAGFVVGAIEETLRVEIAAGRAADAERLFGDLARIAFLQLLGDEDVRARLRAVNG